MFALFRPLVDFILPPRCVACNALTSEPHGVCAACFPLLKFVPDTRCHTCGLPFDGMDGENTVADTAPEEIIQLTCAACIADPPPYTKAIAALVYNDLSRHLILRLKHGDDFTVVPALCRWMILNCPDILNDADVLIPVPLHWTRLWQRRFNQAALIAAGLAKLASIPWHGRTLLRRRPTASQGHLSRGQRQKNVGTAFVVPPNKQHHIKDKTVVLVDDVMTSGATATACTNALLKAGAKRVLVLTAARVTFS